MHSLEVPHSMTCSVQIVFSLCPEVSSCQDVNVSPVDFSSGHSQSFDVEHS